MVSVHVIGGFLGAGKTTTLRSLLTRLGGRERVAVVVNDFGESAIDEALLGEEGVALQEIRGACLCCTAPEGFVGAVEALLERADRILVEPTGLARPADLVDTLRRAPYADRIALGPLVVVVDPVVLASSEEARRQAEPADFLVVNRTDLASPEAIQALDRWVEGLWPAPLGVLRTTHGDVPLDVLSWPEGAGARVSAGQHTHEHVHGTHGHLVRSWSWPPEAVFVRQRLHEVLARLAAGELGPVARLKGLVRTEEGVELVEIAGGQVHARPSDHRRESRLDVIVPVEGAPLQALGDLLAQALRRPDELAPGGVLEVALPDGRRRTFDRPTLRDLPGGIPDVSVQVPGREGAASSVGALLQACGAPEEGEAVVVASDGYVTPPVPVTRLASGWLLHSLGEDPLPAGKGGPFRLLVPGEPNPCANVKGVVRIAVRPGPG